MAMHIRTRRILWSVLAALLLLSIAGVLLRDALVSVVAARVLARRGYRCGPVSAHVPLALPPSIVLGATRCEVAEGPLASVEFKAPLHAHLDGLTIGSLTCASLVLDFRPRARREVELNALGDMTRIVGLDQPTLELMFDAATLSRDRTPPLSATHAEVRRAGKAVMGLHDVRVTYDDEGMTLTATRASVDQAPLLGEGSLRLTATPTAAVATGNFSGNLKVKVVLDHVDATRPKADFSVVAESTQPAK